jgi:uncharacterized protein YxjI
MRLYMKQKVFSWRDRFAIADENGNPRYAAQGEIFSWGKRLRVYNDQGMEVAFIRQKVWSWLPRYYVEIGGVTVCTVVKELSFFRPRYRVEGLPWRLTGNFWAHEYAMYSYDGKTVMRLSKKWFSWGDSYEIDIADAQDELLCLCVALAVDCACHDGHK